MTLNRHGLPTRNKVISFLFITLVLLFSTPLYAITLSKNTENNSEKFFIVCSKNDSALCTPLNTQGQPITQQWLRSPIYDPSNQLLFYIYPKDPSDASDTSATSTRYGYNAVIDARTGKNVRIDNAFYVQGRIDITDTIYRDGSYGSYDKSQAEFLNNHYIHTQYAQQALITWWKNDKVGALCRAGDALTVCIPPIYTQLVLATNQHIIAKTSTTTPTGEKYTATLLNRAGQPLSQTYREIYPFTQNTFKAYPDADHLHYDILNAQGQPIPVPSSIRDPIALSEVLAASNQYSTPKTLYRLPEWQPLTTVHGLDEMIFSFDQPNVWQFDCEASGQQYGLIDRTGHILAACVWDQILPFRDRVLLRKGTHFELHALKHTTQTPENYQLQRIKQWNEPILANQQPSPFMRALTQLRAHRDQNRNIWTFSNSDSSFNGETGEHHWQAYVLTKQANLIALDENMRVDSWVHDYLQLDEGLVVMEERNTDGTIKRKGLYDIYHKKWLPDQSIEVSWKSAQGFTVFSFETKQPNAPKGLLDRNGKIAFYEPNLSVLDYAGHDDQASYWTYHGVKDYSMQGILKAYNTSSPHVEVLTLPRFKSISSDNESLAKRFNPAGLFVINDQGEDKLLNSELNVVGSFAKAFPNPRSNNLAERFTGPIILLDVCYVDDEQLLIPEDYAQRIPKQLRLLCSQPQLRQAEQQVRIDFARYLAQVGNPKSSMQWQADHDYTLSECQQISCIETEINRFKTWIAQQYAQITTTTNNDLRQVENTNTILRPKDRIRVEQHLNIRLNMKPMEDADITRYAAYYIDLTATQKNTHVLVEEMTGAHNNPFWLVYLSQNTSKPFARTLLTGYSGYLGGIQTREKTANKEYPELSTQEHASCCEHVIQFYRFHPNKKRPPGQYQPYLECHQYYLVESSVAPNNTEGNTENKAEDKTDAGTDEALLFCGPATN